MSVSDPLEMAQLDADQGRWTAAAKKCLGVLRQDPGNLDALALYGNLALRLKRPGDALVIFEKMLIVEPNHWGAHEQLAGLFYQQGDISRAIGHAREALRLNPNLVQPHIVLGSILLAENHEREALEEFVAARTLAPGEIEAEVAYAGALLTLGQFGKAAAMLRELIGEHPQEVRLYAMLAQCGKLEEGGHEVELIRSLTDGEGKIKPEYRGQPGLQAIASMALFKLESDLGHYDAAFGYLQAAKGIRKLDMPYSPEDTRRRNAEMRGVFNRDFFSAHPAIGCAEEGPIFIVGMPRSGTTLLERVLSSHPDVAAAGELSLIGRLQQEACAQYGANQYDLAALAKLPEEAWRGIGEEYIRQVRRRVPGGRYFVDKLPGNYRNLGFIRAILPKAKIVHLSRDPMDTCLSIYEQDFSSSHPYANDLGWLGFHYLQYRGYMDYWAGLFGDEIIGISYEMLVSDQAAAARLLGDKLGFELPLENIQQAQMSGRITTASLWQARQPIHAGSVARWKRYEAHLGPLVEALAPVLKRSDQ